MKTNIKAFFAAAFATIFLSTSAFAADQNQSQGYTNITSVKNITKINVSGNVKLILVQDGKEHIQLNDNYYTQNALVQQQGNELRISSFTKQPLTVIAFVNNLSAIEADDNVSIQTSGTFNLLNLKVTLSDNATAHIHSNTLSLISTLNDRSTLKLSGSTETYNAQLGSSSKVNMTAFHATDTNLSTVPTSNSNAIKNEENKGDAILTIF